MSDETTPWVVKGVPQWVRRVVKMYAVSRDKTMAEGLTELIQTAMLHSDIMQRLAYAPDLTQEDAEAIGMDWGMVLLLREQIRKMRERGE